ncbi:DUF6000 family protein [Streptomyces sp. NPDC000405]|uniref:DUF6000 family protein n=1 Tax=Streptomyces sp. NPDC000405 TaxID=3161033 RepID=UPI00398C8ADA
MAHPFFTEYQVSLISRYVATSAEEPRRYLELLHGNFTRLPKPEQSALFDSLADDARAITDADLLSLLETGWRGRLVVGWLIGIDQRTQFRERLGELLLESRMPFACQGYCFALARFGTPADAALLTAYLDRWLRRPECRYDQDWALGALQQIDTRNGSAHAEQFLAPQGLWHQWASVDAGRCNQRVQHFHTLYRAAVAHA